MDLKPLKAHAATAIREAVRLREVVEMLVETAEADIAADLDPLRERLTIAAERFRYLEDLPDADDAPVRARMAAIEARMADTNHVVREVLPLIEAAERRFDGQPAQRALVAARAAARDGIETLHHEIAAATGGAPDTQPQKAHAMPSFLDDSLTDAVSRLQGGALASGGGGLPGDFDRHLAQRLGVTLGLPDLRGETARGTDPAELLAKLRAGLDRSVARGSQAGETRWRFDPVRARGGLDAGSVAGGQGVILRTVRALRAPFVQALHDIGSERHRGDWAERDDLRASAEAGFDALIAEAGQPTGPYRAAVEAAAAQVAFDVLHLAALGDVVEKRGDGEGIGGGFLTLEDSAFDEDTTGLAGARRGGGTNPDFAILGQLLERGEGAFVAELVLPARSEAEVATRDPDLGLLDPEANEAALVAALGHLRVAYSLLRQDLGQAGALGRARIRNDALAHAAASADAALVAVGLSSADLAAIPAGEGGDIDAARLLRWVADAAQADRAVLARDDVSRTDLARILRVRAAQLPPLAALAEARLPGVPNNAFAAGRRELTEVHAHLHRLTEDLRRLVGEALSPPPDDRAAPSEPVRT